MRLSRLPWLSAFSQPWAQRAQGQHVQPAKASVLAPGFVVQVQQTFNIAGDRLFPVSDRLRHTLDLPHLLTQVENQQVPLQLMRNAIKLDKVSGPALIVFAESQGHSPASKSGTALCPALLTTDHECGKLVFGDGRPPVQGHWWTDALAGKPACVFRLRPPPPLSALADEMLAAVHARPAGSQVSSGRAAVLRELNVFFRAAEYEFAPPGQALHDMLPTISTLAPNLPRALYIQLWLETVSLQGGGARLETLALIRNENRELLAVAGHLTLTQPDESGWVLFLLPD